ncbi:FecR domain-containing protein [Sorangium cellulosum]|uniref:FecR domain-containing protein n=1 Tax=Sorangium cellulosum TaxID=56 RepID=UPI000415508D|nr:FecR family protein [Sorangium cellulosum]
MEPVTRRIETLGSEVARTSDQRARPGETLAAARARLFAAEAEARPRRARPAVWAAAAAALLLAAGGAALFRTAWAPAGGPVAATAPAHAPGAGARVEARDAPLAFTFAEGTSVRLDAASALEVLATDARGAELRVERGGADFHVVHRSDTRWVVHAGPYAVRVTGTRFEARWAPEARRFTLALAEGSVEVTGPELGTARLSAGDRLDLTAPREPAPREPAPSGAAAAPASGAPAAVAAPPGDRDARAPAPGAADAAPRWQALASAGRHQEALAAVERLGLDAVLARAAPDELRLLADAARYAGRPHAARAALLALRQRHGARGDAAFLLGKLAADQLGDPGDALSWFDTYLREAPGGALREQALGRSLELQQRRDREAARRAALRYLAEYPRGAYAPLARSIADAP